MNLKMIFPAIVSVSILLFPFTKLSAQTEDQIPAFKMLMTNGRFFQAADLQKNKPVVLIYFAPDCEHCQMLMNEFFKNIEAFKSVQVVLVTFKPLPELLPFEKLYEINKYQNIKLGTEGNTYFLRKFFKLDVTPFTALYDRGGKLIYSYRKETNVMDLINRMRQLQ